MLGALEQQTAGRKNGQKNYVVALGILGCRDVPFNSAWTLKGLAMHNSSLLSATLLFFFTPPSLPGPCGIVLLFALPGGTHKTV
jgi:hypothetical protein